MVAFKFSMWLLIFAIVLTCYVLDRIADEIPLLTDMDDET